MGANQNQKLHGSSDISQTKLKDKNNDFRPPYLLSEIYMKHAAFILVTKHTL